MGQLEDLTPTKKIRVMDLLEEAGFDVSDWANTTRGPTWAAANPRYCYEWSFVAPGRIVALNLWHRKLSDHNGIVSWSDNPRTWFSASSVLGTRLIWRKRAERFENAIQEAFRGQLPIRAIINDGEMRRVDDPKAEASTVKRRLLDPIPWGVTAYDQLRGECTLTRGVSASGSVDQFDIGFDGDTPVARKEVSGSVFVRDPVVRAAALRRANGRCEYCLSPGFTLPSGKVFLETHHVTALADGGRDSADNVAALCPNHHREAHYGSSKAEIRETLLSRLCVRGGTNSTRSVSPLHGVRSVSAEGHH